VADIGYTSSLLLCFCRLALIAELPASLMEVWVSRTGLGMLELAGLLVKGIPPRPWRLGVPLIVLDMSADWRRRGL